MKIFLGNSPWSKPGFYGTRAGSRWPHYEKDGCPYLPFPFFLAYSTALLKKNGHGVELVDAIAERIDDDAFFGRMTDFAPDMVVFEVSTASFHTDLRILARTRELLGPDVKVVFCGPHHVMFQPEFLDEHKDVDFVLVGEYEMTLMKLVQALESPDAGGSFADIEGLVWRDADGKAAKNGGYVLCQDLDSLPWPAREYLPMENYWDNPGGIPAPSLQVIASRGCPFGCIYCAWPQLMYGGNTYRVRSPKDVVDEVEHAVKEYGCKSFYFDDDTFNIGKKRILEICDEIKKRDMNVPWAIMARADQMDDDLLHGLRDAGLAALKYGVESGSQDVLKTACKGLEVEKVRATVKKTRELGIKYHLTFMFGLPGETWETVKQTIDLLIELDPDSYQLSIATPFPGSRFHAMLKESGHLVSEEYDELDGYYHSVVRTDELSPEDLQEAVRMAEKAWNEHQEKKRKAA